MTLRWHKLILCNISAQISQQVNTRRRSFLWSLDHSVTRMIQVRGNDYPNTTAIITRKTLMPKTFTTTRRDANSLEILYILKVSSVQQRNISASLATSMDTLQVCVIKRNKLYSSQGNQRPNVASGSCIFLWQVHMQPLRRLFIQWWVILSASKDTAHTSWMLENSHTISLHY